MTKSMHLKHTSRVANVIKMKSEHTKLRHMARAAASFWSQDLSEHDQIVLYRDSSQQEHGKNGSDSRAALTYA